MAASALSARSAAVPSSRSGLSSGCVMLGCSLRGGLAGGRPAPLRQLSPAREGGLARPVLDEAAHSGALVLGGEQPGELQPLYLQPGLQAGLQAVVDGLLGGAQGERGPGG